MHETVQMNHYERKKSANTLLTVGHYFIMQNIPFYFAEVYVLIPNLNYNSSLWSWS